MITRTMLYALGAFVFVSAAANARGQTPAGPATVGRAAAQQADAPNHPQAAPSRATDSDLSITANVTARELRFDVVPNPKVEFPGKPRRDTLWNAERQNLPRPVQPGVTYRNVGIQLTITSVFADIDRIVAEALGEVPITDEIPTQNRNAPPSQIDQSGQPKLPPPAETAKVTEQVRP